MTEELDKFQQILEDGLLRVCAMSGVPVEMMGSQDIDDKWDHLIKGYVADAVENYNDYPDAALGHISFDQMIPFVVNVLTAHHFHGHS